MGPNSGRGEARPVLARGFAFAGEWPPSYEAQVRSGYLGNPVAQRAVKMVAHSVADAPIDASDEIAALIGVELLESVATHLQLHGNAYVQVLRDADARPAGLFALRPERVRVEVDSSGWPAAYRYAVGERVQRLIADAAAPEVIHLRLAHPLDDHYGLGCLGAAAGAIAVHNAASGWNRALLDNAARPSGALVYDPGDGSTLTRDQFERLRAEMEAGFAGAANAGRPMLLEGGLKWQALSLSPADMDFAGMKAGAAREIALAFGVPPMLLGLPGDATYANYREANKALWRLSVLPMAGRILGGLTDGLKAWWPDARAAVDLDRVPALAEERQALWASVTAADFLTNEEKRQMVDWS
nr:phage portal protein [Sphingomonas sp. EC-HK361]